MNHLFYDVETTGLPDYKSPSEAPHQPHIVQMGAILTDDKFNELARMDVLVRPDGWTIPPEVTAIHGISQDMALAHGIPEEEMRDQFLALLDRAAVRVAFNDPFDARLVRILLKRTGMESMAIHWKAFPSTCAMRMATPRCNMPPTPKMVAAGFNRPKNPKLIEAVKILMGEDMVGAHSAIVDVEWTVKLYRHMLHG